MIPLLPCFKILPLVYDESLSYYEVLCKLTEAMRKYLEISDENFKEIEEALNKIEKLKEYVDQQNQKTLADVDKKIAKALEPAKQYSDELYNQLLEILFTNNKSLRGWLETELMRMKNLPSDQFLITGNPKTTGLLHHYEECIRESQCDFVNTNRWTASTFENIKMSASMFQNIFENAYEIDTKKLSFEPRSFEPTSLLNCSSKWFKSSFLKFDGPNSSGNYKLRVIFSGSKSSTDSTKVRRLFEVYHDNEKIYFKISDLSTTGFTIGDVLENLEFPYQEVMIGLNFSDVLSSNKVVITQPSRTDNMDPYNESFMNKDVQDMITSHITGGKITSIQVVKGDGNSEISSNLYQYYLQYLTI